jgi:hypothetical protein
VYLSLYDLEREVIDLDSAILQATEATAELMEDIDKAEIQNTLCRVLSSQYFDTARCLIDLNQSVKHAKEALRLAYCEGDRSELEYDRVRRFAERNSRA